LQQDHTRARAQLKQEVRQKNKNKNKKKKKKNKKKNKKKKEKKVKPSNKSGISKTPMVVTISQKGSTTRSKTLPTGGSQTNLKPSLSGINIAVSR
jgi:hypothetical protein